MTEPPREMFLCDARYQNAIVDINEEWWLDHTARTRCADCNGWREEVPIDAIDVILDSAPRSIITPGGLFEIVSSDLARVFAKYDTKVILGSVSLSGGRELFGWNTMFADDRDCLEAYRGPSCRHSQCPKCGRIRSANGWAHPAILNRYLDERWCYLGKWSQELFVDRRLVESEGLRARFQNLRLFPVPVLPEPLDGEVLPGDPGWTGTLIRTRRPKPPDTPPVKGIGLWH